MQISLFAFVLIHLHQGHQAAPNADVNETSVELEISFKMLCPATPCAKCYKGVCDNQTRDDHDLDDNEDNNE